MRLRRDKLLAYTGIAVDILDLKEDILRVRVEQANLKNNWLLSQSELIRRARVLFEPLGNRYRIHYVTLSFKPDFDAIDLQWIAERKEVYKLSRNDLSKQLGIDADEIGGILMGSTPLSQQQQAAFYYYFMTYELNRNIREAEVLEN
ncbi:hypothetical protein [Pontibacter indicus]|nr:hypothetical protein [Pontibacter indicus]